MEHPPTIFISPDPPPFPASPRSVDLSPLEFVLALIALVTIPALIYTFFFSIKCPSSPFRSRSTQPSTAPPSQRSSFSGILETAPIEKEVISDVKYQKETHAKDFGNECPVCLSVFADGEEVRQLSVCKHSFHTTCIDLWLNSHANCPVCRASVAVKRPKNHGSVSASRDRDDLHQGLPDASSLV